MYKNPREPGEPEKTKNHKFKKKRQQEHDGKTMGYSRI